MKPKLHAVVEVGTLRHVVCALESITAVALLEISPKEISCRGFDPGRTQITEVRLPAEACERYEADTLIARVDIGWLKNVLSTAPDLATVHVVIDDAKIHLNIGVHKNSQNLLGIIPLDTGLPKNAKRIELDLAHKPPIPANKGYTATMEVRGSFFNQMIDYLLAIDADGLKIVATKTEVVFSSAGGCDMSYRAAGDWLAEYFGDVCALFSMGYLIDIAKTIPADATPLAISVGTAWPLQIKYWTHGCKIVHVLAPKTTDAD